MTTQKTEETKIVNKDVPVKLTEDDFARMGKLAADKGAALRSAKDELDRLKKSHKAKIDTLTSELDATLRAIADGEEVRNVECEEVYRFEQNVVETWFNGDRVNERAMEPHERQTLLFGDKNDEDDKQQELQLVEKPTALEEAVKDELEDDKPTTEVPPLRDQVLDEFKGAQKIVKGW